MKIIGIDIGATEIKGALFLNDKVMKKYSLPTNQSLGKEAVIKTLFEVIEVLLEQGVTKIGIVSAGAIDYLTGTVISNSGTMKEWLGFSIKDEVEAHFKLPTYVDNDANGAMIGEMQEYTERGIQNAVMLTLGTGLGTAVYIYGEIYRGSTNIVEFGHMTLYPNGLKCTCGNHGCAEMYLSGTALTNLAKTRLNKNIQHGSELFLEHQKGDQTASDILDTYLNDLFLYLRNLNQVYDPEIFILGGGVSNAGEVFTGLIERKSKSLHFPKPIVLAKQGNFAGVKGAYYMALKGL